MNYAYGGRDLFAYPESYEYADCSAPAFLAAWRTARRRILLEIRCAAIDADAAPGTLDTRDVPVGAVGLGELLSGLKEGRVTGGLALTDAKSVGDELVAKFEIYRRLHSAYDRDLRRMNGAELAGIADYISFGQVLVMFARLPRGAKYLSTLLKLADALASLDRTDWPVGCASAFADLIESEAELVAAWEGKIS
jgi:hypothetical protein